MIPTLLAALALGAPPDVPGFPVRWEFRDATTFHGRPILTYTPVTLGPQPPRPLHPDDEPGKDARYGLLPLGTHPDGYRMIVWRPTGPDGPEVWVDGNGDGRFGPEKRYSLAQQ